MPTTPPARRLRGLKRSWYGAVTPGALNRRPLPHVFNNGVLYTDEDGGPWCEFGCWGRSISWWTVKSGRSAGCGGGRCWLPWRCTMARWSVPAAWRTRFWGRTAPLTSLNTLQSHVSYVRTLLGGQAAILARSPGYVLELGDDGTDVRLAERLLRQGRQAADPVQGARDLREALALWRGRPLADLAGLAWLEEQAERLDLLGEQIRRALSEARLAAGEHLQLVPELERMATDHRLDEQVHAQLMVALYRSGRQADALSAYQRLRCTLAEELGLVPGPALRELETAILRQDPSLDVPAPATGVRSVAPPAPLRACAAPAGPGAAAAAGGGVRRARRGAGPPRLDPARARRGRPG